MRFSRSSLARGGKPGITDAATARPARVDRPGDGHRVVRVSMSPAAPTLYFHDNAFSAAGDRMMLQTSKGIAVIEVAKLGRDDARLEMVAPEARGGYFARRGREIYPSGRAGNSGGGRGQRSSDGGERRHASPSRGEERARG